MSIDSGNKKHNSIKRRKLNERRRRKIIIRRLVFAVIIVAVVILIAFAAGIRRRRQENAAERAVAFVNRVNAVKVIKTRKLQYDRALQAKQEIIAFQNMTDEQIKAEAGEAAFKSGCVHFVAVGDNLIHETIAATQNYNDPLCSYDALYENIKPYVSSADIAAVNQETVFVADSSQVSGYPAFGTPKQIGDALINAGFDVFGFATNHVYDKGDYGIQSTLSYRDSHPQQTFLGIHGSEEDAAQIRVVESKGIRIAMLDYTGYVNKETDQSRPYLIDIAYAEKITSDVQRAKQMSDFVIVFLHEGTEYEAEPNDNQRYFEQVCLDSGVDALICSHSHVLEGFNRVMGNDGHEMVVYYGLGNFISSQDQAICLLGGAADFYISKDNVTGKCSVHYEDLVPLVTHYNTEKTYYTVFRLEDYNDELAYQHGITSVSGEILSMDWLQYYADYAKQVLY